MTEPKSDCLDKEEVGISISNQCEYIEISNATITKRHKPRTPVAKEKEDAKK